MDKEKKVLEDVLLAHIKSCVKDKDAPPEVAATIPAVAKVLIELWEKFG